MSRFKSIFLVVLCIIAVFTLAACGETEDKSSDTNVNIDLSVVLSDINKEFSIPADEMMQIEDTDSLELFYNILPEDVKQFAAQTTINTATDIAEIILVEAVDEEAADRIYKALDIRYNSQKDLTASYSAELLDIINKCSVEKNGNFVTLIMSSESADITEFYNSYFK
ncbi:MAG: DUF4358 domain-containing protein [Ruminococcus sp.]|nr:DUF4358 domain-containing protein [Ruminococcus sp.]